MIKLYFKKSLEIFNDITWDDLFNSKECENTLRNNYGYKEDSEQQFSRFYQGEFDHSKI